jgi:dihydroorotase
MRLGISEPLNRRKFLHSAAGAASALALRGTLRAAEFDLVIKGGRVIDASQHIDKKIDIAIQGAKIAAVREDIPASSAAATIDAKGMLVVPGLIDSHVHARDKELQPPEFLSTGVTTMVDAGSRGADNVDQLIEIASHAPNRMRILLNIARLGNNNPNGRGEFLDGIEAADVEKAKAALAKNRQWIIGIKARLSRGIAGDLDKEVLRRAVEVATPANVPIMIHMGDTASPLPDLLKMLKRGDIVAHMYAPTPHGILDDKGHLLPEVRAARNRGIRFDFSNGLNEHWNWDVAEKAYKQGFPPDTISTDLTFQGRVEQVFDLPNVMSKFLTLGMPLTQVITCVTKNASQSFPEFKDLGTLRPGTAADVTVLELTQGNFDFVDNYKNGRTGKQKLVTRAVIAGGKRFD